MFRSDSFMRFEQRGTKVGVVEVGAVATGLGEGPREDQSFEVDLTELGRVIVRKTSSRRPSSVWSSSKRQPSLMARSATARASSPERVRSLGKIRAVTVESEP